MKRYLIFIPIIALFVLGLLLINPKHGNADLDRVNAAMKVAYAKWGPVCGGALITTERADLPPPRLAQAFFNYPLDAPDDPTKYFNCKIKYRGGHIAWAQFCTATVHEVGHLAGWKAPPGQAYVNDKGEVDIHHSNNPRSIMYPSLEITWRGCKRRPQHTAY